MFGSSECDGRISVGRRVGCLMAFGNIDLDLRQATLEGDVITIVVFGILGTIDVYVPAGVEVDLHGLAIGGHKRARGSDPPPRPGTQRRTLLEYSLALRLSIRIRRPGCGRPTGARPSPEGGLRRL